MNPQRTFSDLVKFAASVGASALVGKRVLSCLWELTYRCNAKCAICAYWHYPDAPAEEMTLFEIQDGLDKIYAHGCRAVNFTGGEPTLRPDLESIVRHAANLRMWTSMVTNGSLLTRQKIRALRDAGLDNLLISLDSLDPQLHDGHRRISGLHARVVDSLHVLREDFLTGHRTGGIMCVLSRMNSYQAVDIIKFADKHGVFVVIQPYHENKTGNTGLNADITDEMIDELVSMRRQRNNLLSSESYLRGFSRFCQEKTRPVCHAGRKYFSVDPCGGLHPCVDMPAAGHVLGDVISVVRSPDALRNVQSCQGCWYSFRGESDTMLSYQGCFEKLRLALSVMRHNRNAPTNKEPLLVRRGSQ